MQTPGPGGCTWCWRRVRPGAGRRAERPPPLSEPQQKDRTGATEGDPGASPPAPRRRGVWAALAREQ